MDKNKVAQAAETIHKALQLQKFTGEETVCLLKCLERLLEVQALEKGLRLVSDKDFKGVHA